MGFSCGDGRELATNMDEAGGEISAREKDMGMIRAEQIAKTLGRDQLKWEMVR